MKNVVFDLGQVLVEFNPSFMASRYVDNNNDATLLESVVFDRLYWDRLDDGTITDEEVILAVKERLPARLHAVAEKTYYNWIYNIPMLNGIENLILNIKKEFDVKIYLLSNVSTYFAKNYTAVPILKSFDGLVFSGVCKLSKPNVEIYKYLCDKYNLTPQETLFIDDRLENILGAQKVGIKGYRFNGNVNELKNYIYNLLKNN